MPHLSQKKLDRKIFLEIHKRLFDALAQTPDKSRKFIEELLTPTERVMIAKRLSIIVMLGKGFSLPEIVRVLKVSPSTVERIGHEFDSSYRYIGRQFHTAQQKEDIWDTLERMLLMGMPRRVGKERWDFLYKKPR